MQPTAPTASAEITDLSARVRGIDAAARSPTTADSDHIEIGVTLLDVRCGNEIAVGCKGNNQRLWLYQTSRQFKPHEIAYLLSLAVTVHACAKLVRAPAEVPVM